MDAMVVGIDVSKDRLDVAVRPTGESFVFKRTGLGIEDLVAQLEALSPKMVAIEATGGFEAVVAAGLTGAGLPVVVVNPAQVRAFAQALGKRAKTDLIDAAVIAHFAEATKPELRQMPDEMTRLLAGLVARRRQIVEMIAAEGQRARRMSDKRLIKSIARLRKALEKELSELDVLIGDQIRGSAVWAEKEDLLASVPSTVDRSRPLSGSRPGPASLDNGAARASSVAAVRACATLSSSAPWSLRATIRSSKASATNSSPLESQSSSLSSLSPASSSPSSMRYCEIDAHGSKSPLD
jgi:transposase